MKTITIRIIIVMAIMLTVVCSYNGICVKTSEKETYSQQRSISGVYHDYMVIETADGNEWLLDDSKGSPYIKDNHSVFQDGETVQVIFNTMNTTNITDDVVIKVTSIERGA